MATIAFEFFSKSLMRDVRVKAIIPVDKYDFAGTNIAPRKPFKTLYLLHGIFGNESGWEKESRVNRYAVERNLAVIMPAGENHFYTDCEDSDEKYGEFIGEELIDITRRMFNLSNKKEDTFIGGLSMGGYGAIHNGLRYNDTFGYIAGLSSAVDLDSYIYSDDSSPNLAFRRKFCTHVFGNLDKLRGSDKDIYAQVEGLMKEGKELPKFYLCCGTEDFLYEANVKLRDFLKEKGAEICYEEGPGDHNWDFWDEYIKYVIDWLPLDDKTIGVSDGNVC